METTATETTEALAATVAPPGRPLISAEWVKRFLHVIVEPRSYLNPTYMLTALPLGLTYFVVLVGGAITGAFTGITTYMPARSASRIAPAEALRYE